MRGIPGLGTIEWFGKHFTIKPACMKSKSSQQAQRGKENVSNRWASHHSQDRSSDPFYDCCSTESACSVPVSRDWKINLFIFKTFPSVPIYVRVYPFTFPPHHLKVRQDGAELLNLSSLGLILNLPLNCWTGVSYTGCCTNECAVSWMDVDLGIRLLVLGGGH